jgi:hypothetical protein
MLLPLCALAAHRVTHVSPQSSAEHQSIRLFFDKVVCVPKEAYKAELADAYGISFNSLLCLNNMPIKRYVDYLQRKGQLADYRQLLLRSFNSAAAEAVMCRATVSVGWDGRVYDCDFNQQLELGLRSVAFPVGCDDLRC